MFAFGQFCPFQKFFRIYHLNFYPRLTFSQNTMFGDIKGEKKHRMHFDYTWYNHYGALGINGFRLEFFIAAVNFARSVL